ncbi:hypothetical protein [Lutibacter sp. B1]|uniref:hypothetical protein n=1 Tax=Lutibacter sp. B1 TaxID=2725996 RepID=UPI001456D4F8|nr:hypothetical protein [Lutibacter sp. B1]NLP57014.1 hypothetical protein [Lutibacter sp. B1]
MKKIFILFITFFSITISSFSQSNKQFIDTGSVNNQFDYLIEKSNRYQDFKVVKINWLLQLKSNVADSLTASKKEIINNYGLLNSQTSTIDSLKIALNKSSETIDTLNSEKQSVSLFGIQFNKGVFKGIMYSIIALLALLLAFFITKFKQSNSITKQTKSLLKDVEEEFENHRKVALEREQKVMRKLQDEINKQKKE